MFNLLKMNRLNFFVIFMISLVSHAQASFGITGGFQLNSAILPDLEANQSLSSILDGDDVVKGVPQYADVKTGYKLGVIGQYDDGFGFTQLEVTYLKTHIYKEYKLYDGFFGEYTLTALDRKYAYSDLGLSYNIYFSKNKIFFMGIGGSSSFLMEYKGNEEPEKVLWNAFINMGVKINEHISISTRAHLNINEVYKDSYIHHLMLPVNVSVTF